MSENRKLAPNVIDFMGRAVSDYGRIKADEFSQNIFCALVEGKISSPIEDLFYIACHVVAAANFTPLDPEPWNDYTGADRLGYGICIYPQFKIGKYKVDFLLEMNVLGSARKFPPVVVELDGHDFHDKDKHQRAYEKSRDRFLVKNGYSVLHYTGSEVVSDPYRVAHEALSLAGMFGAITPDEYDPLNPLGIE